MLVDVKEIPLRASDIHLSVWKALREKLIGVCMAFDYTFPNEPGVDSLHCLSVHL